jgi:phosphoglycerol transferase MdoB-like AlkP superfamily enzyme
LAALVAAAACVSVFAYGTRNITSQNWSNEGATRNGYFLNFAVGLRDCFVKEPEGYSPEAVSLLEQEYSGERENDGQKPNIIVIMNESYGDFSVLGSALRTNVPVTPFADSLTENTVRGYALTSIFGGTTANAEFEFLTGFSMSGVPEGSCPYQQYINAPTLSLARLLGEYGYETFATHPYFASGWIRTAVYPRLGFE